MKRLLVFGFLLSMTALFLYSCQKELSQESNLNNASFSLHDDSTKACYPITVNGTYYNGVSAERDTNFIKVVVNVKSTGSYSIATDSLYGFYFSASGFFSTLGLDTVILTAKGTPILMQTDDFILSADTLGTCSFSIDVKDSTGSGLGGSNGGVTAIDTSYIDPSPAGDSSWQFTDSAANITYSGQLPSSLTSVAASDGVYVLSVTGYNSDQTQLFGFSVDLPGSEVTTGIYPINDNNLMGLEDLNLGVDLYYSDASSATGAPSYSYIHITSYDPVTKNIKGSFHCWAVDDNDNPKLMKGSFNAYLP